MPFGMPLRNELTPYMSQLSNAVRVNTLFQKRLTLADGLIDTTGGDEIVLLCRRGTRA